MHTIEDISTSVLRDLISRCSDRAEIDTIHSLLNPQSTPSDGILAAAATLRQARLLISSSREERRTAEPHGVRVKLLELRPSRLQPRVQPRPFTYLGLEMATYNGRCVIVEWKVAEGPLWDLVANHVRRLGWLLSQMNDPSFHTLPWHGLLPLREKGRFGLVYKPGIDVEGHDAGWCYTGLPTVIANSDIAPLNRRVEIAREMAETVLQLHTTGWPHKGIRSENVLFFAAQAAELAEVAEQKAYLVGFEYARPDSKAGAAVTQLPDTPADTDLYRHPDARGGLRKSYRKHFDLCSLGCLLLELVLWKPLIKVMTDDRDEGPDRSTKSLEPNGSEIQSSSLGSLNFAADKRLQLEVKRHVGPVFCEAIIRCFASGADDDSSLKQQEAILATLQRVNV